MPSSDQPWLSCSTCQCHTRNACQPFDTAHAWQGKTDWREAQGGDLVIKGGTISSFTEICWRRQTCITVRGCRGNSLSATVREWIRASWAVPHPVHDRSGMALSFSPYQRRTEGHLMTAWLADNSYQSVRQSKYSNGGYRAADYIRKGQSERKDKN